MVNDNGRNPLVGIASVVCGVILAMGILSMLFLPSSLATIATISGYLVILGIVLGFFQFSLEKEELENARMENSEDKKSFRKKR
jgi:hypothetical protein